MRLIRVSLRFFTYCCRRVVLISLTLLPVLTSIFLLGCFSTETVDGVELLSDIPDSVRSAVNPDDPGSGLCRNSATGDEVKGVFDVNGMYFPVGFGRIKGQPDACVIQGTAATWRNQDKTAQSLKDLKIDLREYVFHAENKKAIPTSLEYIGVGNNRTLVGYVAQTTVTVIREDQRSFPTVTTSGRRARYTPVPAPVHGRSAVTPTLPIPTPTLLEQALMNVPQCIVGAKSPNEILPDPSGAAFVKAGWYSDPNGAERVSGGTLSVPPESPKYYRYWRYEPDPTSGTFACEEITFREYPAPVLTEVVGEARVEEVEHHASESCRNWVRVWREGKTFLDTDVRKFPRGGSEQPRRELRVEETRPVNERYALVLVHHRYKFLISSRPIGGRATWSAWRTDPIHMVYDVGGNSCRETEYAATAWQLWPEVPPELDPLGTTETAVESTPASVDTSTLTAEFRDVPTSHNGSDEFTFELRFNTEVTLSYKTLRGHAFTVTSGTVTKARRLHKPSNIRWEITVRPDGEGDVTIALPATLDCADGGAICTEEGMTLANHLKLTVTGPSS